MISKKMLLLLLSVFLVGAGCADNEDNPTPSEILGPGGCSNAPAYLDEYAKEAELLGDQLAAKYPNVTTELIQGGEIWTLKITNWKHLSEADQKRAQDLINRFNAFVINLRDCFEVRRMVLNI